MLKFLEKIPPWNGTDYINSWEELQKWHSEELLSQVPPLTQSLPDEVGARLGSMWYYTDELLGRIYETFDNLNWLIIVSYVLGILLVFALILLVIVLINQLRIKRMLHQILEGQQRTSPNENQEENV